MQSTLEPVTVSARTIAIETLRAVPRLYLIEMHASRSRQSRSFKVLAADNGTVLDLTFTVYRAIGCDINRDRGTLDTREYPIQFAFWLSKRVAESTGKDVTAKIL